MAKKKTKKEKSFLDELKARKPVLQFIGGFIVFTVVFYLITNAPWFESFRKPLVNLYSKSASVILNLFSFNTKAIGSVLQSQSFSVNIQEGCDAIVPTILFVAAILVFPADWKYKLKGVLSGVVILFVVNLLRIITLYLTGVYQPKLFDFMHVEFWQVLFIVFTVMLFINWLKGTQKIPS